MSGFSQYYRNFIDITISAATLLTAIAALLNVRLLKKQQTIAHSPQIYAKNEIYNILHNGQWVPFVVSQEKTFENNIPVYAMNDAPYIIRNIGLGSAKNINIEWIYDKEKLKNAINTEGKNNIRIDSSVNNLYHFSNRHTKDYGFTINDGRDDKMSIASIIPGEENLLKIPDSLLNLIVYIIKNKQNDEIPFRYENIFTEIKLSITYFDISNRKYKEKINVIIDAYMHLQDEIAPNLPHGYLIFKYNSGKS